MKKYYKTPQFISAAIIVLLLSNVTILLDAKTHRPDDFELSNTSLGVDGAADKKGGNYTLSSKIGEPAAGSTMHSAEFELRSGAQPGDVIVSTTTPTQQRLTTN